VLPDGLGFEILQGLLHGWLRVKLVCKRMVQEQASEIRSQESGARLCAGNGEQGTGNRTRCRPRP
jgi:hypothetical protein